jgi:hypothetical protein
VRRYNESQREVREMNIQKKAAEHTRTAKLHNDTQKQKTKNKIIIIITSCFFVTVVIFLVFRVGDNPGDNFLHFFIFIFVFKFVIPIILHLNFFWLH